MSGEKTEKPTPKKIKDSRKKGQVPVVEYVALARAIYRDCQPEEYIKSDHLEMAAAVFREIMNAMDGNDDQT